MEKITITVNKIEYNTLQRLRQISMLKKIGFNIIKTDWLKNPAVIVDEKISKMKNKTISNKIIKRYFQNFNKIFNLKFYDIQ